MKSALLSTLVVLSFAPVFSMAQDKSAQPYAYELYSWRDKDGGWNFSMLLMTDRLKTSEEIFDEKETIRGLANLKKRISRAQRNWAIFLMHKFSSQKTIIEGREKLEVPPKEIIEEIERVARKRSIAFKVLSES